MTPPGFRRCAPWLAALTLAVPGACGMASHAATMPIDDTGTVTVQPTMNLRWQELSPRQRRGDLMEGSTQLRVRLNVKPWMGRSGRIYLVLPAQLPGDIAASWTTTGRLLPGRVQSGSRTLVYAGTITAPVLEDTLVLSLAVDGRQMRQTYNLQFRFEIDED
jgi:hypothetical protein